MIRGFHLVLAVSALVSAPLLAENLGPVSEENPPAACDPGAFVTTVRCTGSYCDNIAIRCARIVRADIGAAVWMPFVSEEGGGQRNCPANHYIAGFACNYRYCDNVSLYCVEASNLTPSNCSWTASVSEERGGLLALGREMDDAGGVRVAARAMKCEGRYCDNKSFEVCEVTAPRPMPMMQPIERRTDH